AKPGSESEWVSVDDLTRNNFSQHPWSLSGGGAGALMASLEEAATAQLGGFAESIGIASVTGEDDLYLLSRNGSAERNGIVDSKPLVTGEVIRDFILDPEFDSIWVYNSNLGLRKLEDLAPRAVRLLKSYRTSISSRKRFGVPM